MHIAIFLAISAVALPVHRLARLLTSVDATAAHVADVTLGIWVLKGALLLTAAYAVLIARLRPALHRASAWIPGLARREQPVRAVEWAVLAGALAAALGLRLVSLSAGLWIDEIQTLVDYVRLPLPQLLATFDSQNQHLLYSVLARVSSTIFGESAWSLRIPAVLFGVGSVAALFWFARTVATTREALLAVVLITVSYHHIWFSQNARGYTGLLLWTLVGTGLFVRLLSAPGVRLPRLILAYGGVMALAHYTHISAAFITAAHGLVWLGLLRGYRPEPAPARVARYGPGLGFLGVIAFTLLLYAPVLPQFLETLLAPTHGGAAGEWKSALWFLRESWRVLTLGIPGGSFVLLAAIGVFGLGLWSYARQSLILPMLMVLPGILTAGAVLILEHNFWPRFFFFGFGFGILIAVRGVLELATLLIPRQAPAAATAALTLAAAASAITISAAWNPKQDFGGALEYVQRTRASGDAVVAVDMSGFVYSRYLQPSWRWVRSANELSSVENRRGRTWVLYTFPTKLSAADPEIWRRLQQSYRPAAEFPGTVGGGTVYVVVNR